MLYFPSPRWSADAPGFLVFRALLLTSGPSTLSGLVSRLCAALQPLLSNQDGDPALRLSALQLLDALMEDQDRSGRGGVGGGRFLLISTWGTRPSPVGIGSALHPPCCFSACCRGLCLGGDAASTVLSQLLLPPLVWQAGKTSAAVRFSAITALATMLRRRLVPGPVLLELVVAGSLLPPINQSMDEVSWQDDAG